MSAKSYATGPNNLITDVQGITVGHAQHSKILTGTTVILPAKAAVAAYDSRGGAPGTRETDALRPSCLVEKVDAIVLSGGSVYGLAAASAVTDWLGARGRGFPLTPPLVAPVVPCAILFDLANGGDKNWKDTQPYYALGQQACSNAGTQFALGNSGAGYGATAGPYKGGMGSCSMGHSDGLMVGALAAVNAFGCPTIPTTRRFWAADFAVQGELGQQPPPPKADGVVAQHLFESGTQTANVAANTTLGVIATNAKLTPSQAERIAIMAHDGMARALRPVHTPFDGDTVFVLATGEHPLQPEPAQNLDVLEIGAMAADCLARAIARGVYEAETLGSMVSYKDSL